MKKTALLLAVVVLLAPVSMFAEDTAAGQKIYTEKKCAMCHGANFEKKDVKVTDASVKFLLEDAKHKSKITSEADAKAVIAYVKSIKK